MRYTALVVAVALLTRLAVVLWLHETVPYSDFVLYHAAGVETARDPGFLFERAAAARMPQINLWPPGYPAFLASVNALSGPNHRHAVFVQVLLGVAVCWLVFRSVASRALGRPFGCVAGLLVALHPHLVFLTNQLASENLYLVWLGALPHLGARHRRWVVGYNVGRIASAAAPFVVGSMAGTRGFGVAFTITGAAFLVAALMWIGIPATQNRELTV